jgi:cellulose biosynthesis protein BcsQ
MALKELRALKPKHRLVVTPSRAEKVKITGLSEDTIEKLETRKEKATLEEIIIYCNKLHISFQQFLPELFLSYK